MENLAVNKDFQKFIENIIESLTESKEGLYSKKEIKYQDKEYQIPIELNILCLISFNEKLSKDYIQISQHLFSTFLSDSSKIQNKNFKSQITSKLEHLTQN